MKYAEWQSHEPAESSVHVRARVSDARRRQIGRQGVINARMDTATTKAQWALVEPAARALLAAAVDRFTWSARSAARIVRVARTIADLDDAECIGARHLAEALQFRATDGGDAT